MTTEIELALRAAREAMEWATQDNEPLRASTVGKLYQALNAVDEALKGPAAQPTPEVVPEIERVKAENASLEESYELAVEQRNHFHAGLDAAKAENASLLESLREAKLEAKEALDFWERANEYAQVLAPKLAAAEKRNTELEGALRRIAETPDTVVLNDGAHAGDVFQQIARAALHDEERSAPGGEDGKQGSGRDHGREAFD